MKIEMPCIDCGKETMQNDYYMLKEELWMRIMP